MRDVVRWLSPEWLLELRRRLLDRIYAQRSAHILRGGVRARTGAQAVRMLQRYRGIGDAATLHSVQVQDEITGVLDFLIAERVQTACEIGTYLGGTLFMLSRILPDDALIVSVDWPDVAPDPDLFRRRKPFYESFARKQQRLVVVHGDSTSTATLARVEAELGGRPLDFVFIDGDHSPAGASADFLTYAPLVRPGGFVGFHDIVPNDVETWGVATIWSAARHRWENVEFADEHVRQARRGLGIGVLRWDGGTRAELQAWFAEHVSLEIAED